MDQGGKHAALLQKSQVSAGSRPVVGALVTNRGLSVAVAKAGPLYPSS